MKVSELNLAGSLVFSTNYLSFTFYMQGIASNLSLFLATFYNISMVDSL